MQDFFFAVEKICHLKFFKELILKKNVHSGELPHTEKQLEIKTQDFMNRISNPSDKISNLFLHEKLFFVDFCFVA